MLGGRRNKWPTIEVPATRPWTVRGDIKSLSLQELERLMAIAAANPEWSATGRPAWVRDHKDDIRQVMLTVFVREHPAVYRCMVTAMLDDESRGQFTLDVSSKDFDRLTDIAPETLVTLAHRYLWSFPDIELDPDQKEAWRRVEG